MNGYKKIIKNQKIRFFLIKAMTFLPDKWVLRIQYRMKVGRKLNLVNPKTYTGKLQLYKLNYHDNLMTICSDKHSVRSYVKGKGLERILVNSYGSFNTIYEVDFNKLPEQFVIKTNNGSGTNIFVTDKSKINLADIDRKLKAFFNRSRVFGGREWCYYNIEEKIVIEELLINDQTPGEIEDFKFICVNGDVKTIVHDIDRYKGHKRNFYDINWNHLKISSDCPMYEKKVEKPDNLNEMLDIAKILSADFPSCRVDLYNIKGKIYFGEITFYPWSGYVIFRPSSFDEYLGEGFDFERK